MKIINLFVQNVKKIKVADITPTSALVEITGKNGSGKSSILDSILFALAGTRSIQSQPVRNGTRKATIRLDLGDLVVTRRMNATGGGSLVVEAKDGTPLKSPQGVLDKLFGDLTFDPLAFATAEPKKQLEMLRALVKVDADLDALDAANAADFAERARVNAEAKAHGSRLGAIPGFPVDLPAAPVDVDALLEQMENASAFNSDVDNRRAVRAAQQDRVEEMQSEAEEFRTRAISLAEEAKALALTIEFESSIPARMEVADLRRQVQDAQATNKLIEQKATRDVSVRALRSLEATAEKLTEQMDARKDQKAAAIGAAKMPVDGLGFGEGMVMFKGVPFDQASSAEQLRVSVAMAMAANPELRILRIKDGSLLDEDNLALIASMAEERDWQCWIERVETSGTVGVVMVDGAVAGAAVEEEEDEPAVDG